MDDREGSDTPGRLPTLTHTYRLEFDPPESPALLFGKLRLDSPRLYHCGCCSKEERRSFSPLAELLTERTAPELAYLENKFAAMNLVRVIREAIGRSAADWRGYQRSWRLPKSATGSRTDGGGTGRRKVAIHRRLSARLGCAASAGAAAHRRIGWRLYPRQGSEVPW